MEGEDPAVEDGPGLTPVLPVNINKHTIRQTEQTASHVELNLLEHEEKFLLLQTEPHTRLTGSFSRYRLLWSC